MTKQELKNYLVDEAEYSQEEVDQMSPFELIDAWLVYNGIIGFTQDIIDLTKAVL